MGGRRRARKEKVEVGCGERPKPISSSQFLSWKRRKDADASAKKAEAARKRAEEITSGTIQMNGRELFLNEPWVFDNTHY